MPKITSKDGQRISIRNKNEDDVLALYEDFLSDIEDAGFNHYPSKSNFSKWLGTTRSEVYAWCSAHIYAKNKMEAMTADTLVEGMLTKKYAPQGAIFTLKNVCKWEDSPKKTQAQTTQQTRKEKEAKKLVDEYIKEEREKSPLYNRYS